MGCCGPQGSWLEKWIPDGPFAPACLEHDKDYARGGSEAMRFGADKKFLEHMQRIALGLRPPARWFWLIMARVYYRAVRKHGAAYWGKP